MVLTSPWLSPVSFAPNMFRNMVKLMGPEASLSMASSSSSLMLVLPVTDTRQEQECYTSLAVLLVCPLSPLVAHLHHSKLGKPEGGR